MTDASEGTDVEATAHREEVDYNCPEEAGSTS